MEEQFRTVARSDCYESPLNNRHHFDEAKLQDLTASIASKGVLTPLLMRENANGPARYEILAGARRFRAAGLAKVDDLPAVVRSFTDDEALEVVVIENLQREDVAPLEEAEGYRALLDRPGYDVAGIAAKIGKSEAYVYQRLKLCDLIDPAKKALREEAITPGHALLLARLQHADQKEALKHCFEDRWTPTGTVRLTVSVRALSGWIHQNLQLELKSAPFDTNDALLVAGVGTCAACPKRSGFAPALFPDITGKDVCTDRACFQNKVATHLARTKQQLEETAGPVVEISTRYGGEKKGAPLPFGRWTEIKRGEKKCDHAQAALVTDGDRDLGKALTVCASQSCKVHHGSGGGMYSTTASPAEKARRAKEQETQRQAADLRRRLFQAVHAAAPTKLGRAEHDQLVAGYIEEMQQDSIRALVQALGIEPVKAKRGYAGGGTYTDWQDTAEKWVKGLDDDAIVRALVILPLVPGLEGRDWMSDRRKGLLRKAAALYGVDVKAIEKAIDTEAKERAAKKAARAKKSAAKPKNPARATNGRSCESCGCTEAKACEGGCAWDQTFQKKGRWVCTTPACVKSATSRGARKAKKAAPAKAARAKKAKKAKRA